MYGGFTMNTSKFGRRLVLWMALGDGTLNANGYLSIRHSAKQKEYLQWKHDVLKENGIGVTDLYYVDNNGYGAWEFRTKSYDFIKQYRKLLYHPSKQIGNKKILRKVETLGIFIWYLDDGSLTKYKERGKVVGNNLMINTYTSKEENQIIIDWFNENFHVSFGQNKDKGRYRLRCGTKQARIFLSIIEQYKHLVPSMAYKFDVKPNSLHGLE